MLQPGTLKSLVHSTEENMKKYAWKQDSHGWQIKEAQNVYSGFAKLDEATEEQFAKAARGCLEEALEIAKNNPECQEELKKVTMWDFNGKCGDKDSHEYCMEMLTYICDEIGIILEQHEIQSSKRGGAITWLLKAVRGEI